METRSLRVSLSGVAEIFRPGLVALVAFGTLLGAVLSGALDVREAALPGPVVRMTASACLLALAASWNVRFRAGRIPAIAAGIGAAALAAGVSRDHLVLLGAAVVLAVAFPYAVRRFAPLRHAAMPVGASFALVYGGWAGPVGLSAALAALLLLSRDLMAGGAKARRVAAGALCAAMLLTPLPFLLFDYRGIYLLLMLVANGFMLWSFRLLADRREPARAVLDLAMGAAAIALACGAIVQWGD